MRDKALELQDREGHREMATLEEPQDMEQQVSKTHGFVDAPAMHKEASLKLQVTEEAALEEPELEEDATLATTFVSVLALLGFLGGFFSVAARRFCLAALTAGGFAKELQAKGSCRH